MKKLTLLFHSTYVIFVSKLNEINSFSSIYSAGASEILQRDGKKQPCRRHWTTNDCSFGFNCRFLHKSPAEMAALSARAAAESSDVEIPEKLLGKSVQKWVAEEGWGKN